MTRIFFFIALFLYSLIAASAELKGENKAEGFAYPYLYFVSGGDALEDGDFKKLRYFKEGTSVGAHYRVGFISSAIYTSILVELITFGEEDSDHKIRETYLLSSAALGDVSGNDSDIVDFDKWITPRMFRIVRNGSKKSVRYDIHIAPGGKFSINEAH